MAVREDVDHGLALEVERLTERVEELSEQLDRLGRGGE
jgi:hypothetical protein